MIYAAIILTVSVQSVELGQILGQKKRKKPPHMLILIQDGAEMGTFIY